MVCGLARFWRTRRLAKKPSSRPAKLAVAFMAGALRRYLPAAGRHIAAARGWRRDTSRYLGHGHDRDRSPAWGSGARRHVPRDTSEAAPAPQSDVVYPARGITGIIPSAGLSRVGKLPAERLWLG